MSKGNLLTDYIENYLYLESGSTGDEIPIVDFYKFINYWSVVNDKIIRLDINNLNYLTKYASAVFQKTGSYILNEDELNMTYRDFKKYCSDKKNFKFQGGKAKFLNTDDFIFVFEFILFTVRKIMPRLESMYDIAHLTTQIGDYSLNKVTIFKVIKIMNKENKKFTKLHHLMMILNTTYYEDLERVEYLESIINSPEFSNKMTVIDEKIKDDILLTPEEKQVFRMYYEINNTIAYYKNRKIGSLENLEFSIRNAENIKKDSLSYIYGKFQLVKRNLSQLKKKDKSFKLIQEEETFMKELTEGSDITEYLEDISMVNSELKLDSLSDDNYSYIKLHKAVKGFFDVNDEQAIKMIDHNLFMTHFANINTNKYQERYNIIASRFQEVRDLINYLKVASRQGLFCNKCSFFDMSKKNMQYHFLRVNSDKHKVNEKEMAKNFVKGYYLRNNYYIFEDIVSTEDLEIYKNPETTDLFCIYTPLSVDRMGLYNDIKIDGIKNIFHKNVNRDVYVYLIKTKFLNGDKQAEVKNFDKDMYTNIKESISDKLLNQKVIDSNKLNAKINTVKDMTVQRFREYIRTPENQHGIISKYHFDEYIEPAINQYISEHSGAIYENKFKTDGLYRSIFQIIFFNNLYTSIKLNNIVIDAPTLLFDKKNKIYKKSNTLFDYIKNDSINVISKLSKMKKNKDAQNLISYIKKTSLLKRIDKGEFYNIFKTQKILRKFIKKSVNFLIEDNPIYENITDYAQNNIVTMINNGIGAGFYRYKNLKPFIDSRSSSINYLIRMFRNMTMFAAERENLPDPKIWFVINILCTGVSYLDSIDDSRTLSGLSEKYKIEGPLFYVSKDIIFNYNPVAVLLLTMFVKDTEFLAKIYKKLTGNDAPDNLDNNMFSWGVNIFSLITNRTDGLFSEIFDYIIETPEFEAVTLEFKKVRQPDITRVMHGSGMIENLIVQLRRFGISSSKQDMFMLKNYMLFQEMSLVEKLSNVFVGDSTGIINTILLRYLIMMGGTFTGFEIELSKVAVTEQNKEIKEIINNEMKKQELMNDKIDKKIVKDQDLGKSVSIYNYNRDTILNPFINRDLLGEKITLSRKLDIKETDVVGEKESLKDIIDNKLTMIKKLNKRQENKEFNTKLFHTEFKEKMEVKDALNNNL